ncbi:serine hydrolase domain-containing protein [Variovorax sp. VNK109]|uniref:serine hydrolase domain-containing protein n=1 Tax=Variovorax sp. VNK109 TaxID=3400919 RepID=UPI003BFBEA71
MRAAVLSFSLCLFAATSALAQTAFSWRDSTADEQRLDAIAFEGFDKGIAEGMGDVQSVVVVLQGRTVYQYYRDGNPDTLRDMQSVTKSALAVLMGIAMQRAQITSLDQRVLDLMPQWQSLNADPRAQAITLRHLLSMTSGFAVQDATGIAPPLPPAQAWARPLRGQPGQLFAYDNSMPVMVGAILEKVTGRSYVDYASEHLVKPLGMKEPSYARGLVSMRTIDMARLGQLVLQDGRWGNEVLLPPSFVADMVKPHSAGGPPAGLPYGLFWWVPSGTTYFASGYAGQLVMVHPPLDLVIAVTSTVSVGSQERGQATRLARGRLFKAAQKRLEMK